MSTFPQTPSLLVVATIDIPIRLRFGMHGAWAKADGIGLAAYSSRRLEYLNLS